MEAFRAEDSKGRRYNENYNIILEDFFDEDFTRLLDSRALRRLLNKTQVITDSGNHYIRNRRTHTDEVISVSMQIGGALGLNLGLIKAIAAGHDIGHTPYGHFGETVLSELTKRDYRHATGSVVIAQEIEKRDGRALNLSFETLEGILCHSKTELDEELKSRTNAPHEYGAVMCGDKISYTVADLNDSLRSKWLKDRELPDFVWALGKDQDEKKFKIIDAVIKESREKDRIEFKGEVNDDTARETYSNFEKTRKFMFENVYEKMHHDVKRTILTDIYGFFEEDKYFEGVKPEVAFVLLTDRDATTMGHKLIEDGRLTSNDSAIKSLGIMEDIEIIRGRDINIFKADLNWGNRKTA